MTRDDRDVMHEGPCPCRAGSVEVVHVTPGGAYGKARWQKSIGCEQCSVQYELRHNEMLRLGAAFDVWFVRRDDSTGTRIPAAPKD